MKVSKYVGFLVLALGLMIMSGAALLPVAVDRGNGRITEIRFRMDQCGPALFSAVGDANPACQEAAQKRLVTTTGIGLILVAFGVVLCAGGNSRRSRLGSSRVPPRLSRY